MQRVRILLYHSNNLGESPPPIITATAFQIGLNAAAGGQVLKLRTHLH